MSQIFKEITDFDNLYAAYLQVSKSKNKYSKEALLFSQNETANLLDLQQQLINGTYSFDDYIEFKVFEPKERVINAPHFKDKIVQIAIDNILKPIFEPTFISHSYACIDNRGTHKAVEKVQRNLKQAKWQLKEPFIIKFDVSRFFYSIDREILKSILRRKIKCNKTLSLLDVIIDSAARIDKTGIPLGNATSQLFANIYLNELDNYCKRKLKIKFYVRYMDDVVAIIDGKENTKNAMNKMIAYVNAHLNLTASIKKTKIFPLAQGVNVFGYKVYTTHRLLRNDSKKKIKRKIKKMKRLIVEGRLKKEKAEQIFNSWYGHSKHANSFNFIQSLIKKNDYVYLDNKNIIRVKEVMK